MQNVALSQFIRENVEEILGEWENFARGLPAAGSMDITALRDHAREMLKVIAADLEQAQTSRQQAEKARGLSDAPDEGQTAAQEHGAGRAGSGFSVEAMVSEFRALRASVIQLWLGRRQHTTEADLGQLIRFNEAIDQAIAESITTYTGEVTQSKDRFLAILGHDLRSPIGTITAAARFMLEETALEEPHRALITTIDKTGRRMSRLVSDLLEFTRSRFGDEIPVHAQPMDAREVAADVAAEVDSSFAGIAIEVRAEGDTTGNWDRERLTQALMNLVSNAIYHGARGTPITTDLRGSGDAVAISVRNSGTPIPEARIVGIFDAMKALSAPDGKDRRHLGLGLYIVDRIIRAHGGSVSVESRQDQTTFTLTLPRATSTTEVTGPDGGA